MFGNVTYHDFANALCNKLQGAERLYGLRTNLLWKDKETAHLIFEEVIYRKIGRASCRERVSDLV